MAIKKKLFVFPLKILLCCFAFISNATYADPLQGPFTTKNGQVIEKNNKPVSFNGINWFGFNTGNHIVHGLWQSDFNEMLAQIKSLGFNAVRLPFQFDFIFDTSIKPSGINTSCNGPNSCNTNVPQDSALHAFQWVIEQFTNNGIYVLIDDHYEDSTYVTHPNTWQEGWIKVAQMFKNNPLVGYDLWNEPDSHGTTWQTNTSGGPAWGPAVMKAANAIYSVDPTKLIFIEGTAQGALESNWGDGFATDDQTVQQGVSNPKEFFSQLLAQPFVNQIVISPHIYGPDGTNGNGPDHSNKARALSVWSKLHGYLFNNFSNVNNTNLSGFCLNHDTCHVFPIAVGEFGGRFQPNDPQTNKDVATQLNIAAYLKKLAEGQEGKPSWFYWDWNPNSGNTGGILKDDWKTIDCVKVNYLVNNLGLKPDTGIC